MSTFRNDPVALSILRDRGHTCRVGSVDVSPAERDTCPPDAKQAENCDKIKSATVVPPGRQVRELHAR